MLDHMSTVSVLQERHHLMVMSGDATIEPVYGSHKNRSYICPRQNHFLLHQFDKTKSSLASTCRQTPRSCVPGQIFCSFKGLHGGEVMTTNVVYSIGRKKM